MENVRNNLDKNYAHAISTLKNCSYDSENKIYLCDFEEEVYDFDVIKERYCERMRYKDMASMDSLIEVNKKNMLFLVEFKNKDSLPYKDIRAKIHDSLFIMENDFQVPREMFSMFELIVVYNPKKKQRTNLRGIREHFRELAGEEHDEIEHFQMFKDIYNIRSLKFSNEDFLEYLAMCS